MSKYCIRCGKEIADNSQFCIRCGAKQVVTPPPAADTGRNYAAGKHCIRCGRPLAEKASVCLACGAVQDTSEATIMAHKPIPQKEEDLPTASKESKPKRSKKPLVVTVLVILLLTAAAAGALFFLSNMEKGLAGADEIEQMLNDAYMKALDDDDYRGVRRFRTRDADEKTHDQTFTCDVVSADDDISSIQASGFIKNDEVIQLRTIYFGYTEPADPENEEDRFPEPAVAIFPISIFKEDIDTPDEFEEFLSEMDVISEDESGSRTLQTAEDNIEYTYVSEVVSDIISVTFTVRYLPAFDTGLLESDLTDTSDTAENAEPSPSTDTTDTTDTSAADTDLPLPTDPNAVYTEKITEYKQAIKMGFDSFNEKYRYGSDCTSINALMLRAAYNSGGYIGYSFCDIDKNGTDELIFTNLQNIIDIYTVKDGNVIKLFKDAYFGDRIRVHVLSDGRLLTEGSGSVSSGSSVVYEIDPTDGNLRQESAYYYDSNGPSSYMVGYSYLAQSQYGDILTTWLSDSIFESFSWTLLPVPVIDRPADTPEAVDTTAADTTSPEETAAHTHSFGRWTRVNDATHRRICACGEIRSEAHTFDAGVVTVAPTDLTAGVKTYTCTKCGETKTEALAKLQHTHSYGKWIPLNDSTHYKGCSCGDTIAEAHTFDDGKVTKQPTATSLGVKTYTCIICGDTVTESIAKLDHTHSYGKWAYNDDTTHVRVCACGNQEKGNHVYDSGRVTKQPTAASTGEKVYTCTLCGAKKTETLPKLEEHTHSYSDWFEVSENTHARACSCGVDQTEPHAFGNGTVILQPTDTMDGIMSYTCALCGAVKESPIPKSGSSDSISYEFTRVCDVCGLSDGTVPYTLQVGVEVDVSWTCSHCEHFNGYTLTYSP